MHAAMKRSERYKVLTGKSLWQLRAAGDVHREEEQGWNTALALSSRRWVDATPGGPW